MNFRTKHFATLAILALGLLSCNKEQQMPTPAPADAVESYAIDLEALGDELRLAQVLDDNEMTKVQNGVFLEQKDLRVQLAVKRGSSVVTQVIRLRKVPNQNKVVYTQLVKVPAGTSDDIQLSAVVLSELTPRSNPHQPEPSVAEPGSDDTRFMEEEGDMGTTNGVAKSIKADKLVAPEMKQTPSGDNIKVVRTKIPYVADWTNAKLLPGTGGAEKRISPVKLVFKPSGTLLRLQIRNTTLSPVRIRKIQVETTAFVDQWSYTLGQNKLSGDPIGVLSAPRKYEWHAPDNTVIPVYTSDDVKPSHLFVWVKGTPSTAPVNTKVTVITEDGGFKDVFQSTDPLKPGTMTVPIMLSYSKFIGGFDGSGDSGLINPVSCNPIDRVKSIPYDPSTRYIKIPSRPTGQLIDPSTILMDYRKVLAANVHYNTPQMVEAYGRNRNPEYYAPSIWELGILFPSQRRVLSSGTLITAATSAGSFDTTPTEFTEQVQFGQYTPVVLAKSVYKGDGRNARVGAPKRVYALRFYDYDNNSKRTAVRYEVISRGRGTVYDSVNKRPKSGEITALKITMRWLGPALNYTIDQIAQESFWNNVSPDDVVRYLPSLGTRSMGSEVQDLDQFADVATFFTGTYNDRYSNIGGSMGYSNVCVQFALRMHVSGGENFVQSQNHGTPLILFRHGGC